MVSKIDGRAIKISETEDITWYRCNKCHDMFSYMVHFTDSWDFYYCIPRRCPNCGTLFNNRFEVV